MKINIYVEGGASDAKEQKIRCQQGFHELFKKMGLQRSPKIVACGSRNEVLDRFRTSIRISALDEFIAMLVDSEDPVADIHAPWAHLKQRDDWSKPEGTGDDQVFLMTTCMETWIVADRAALKTHYKKLAENALPPLVNLESRHRHDVQERLEKATKDCSNAYAKGKQSFLALAVVEPAVLRQHLPSFDRMAKILAVKLTIKA